ncbi:unnamed protein product [Merluccius merluccius]
MTGCPLVRDPSHKGRVLFLEVKLNSQDVREMAVMPVMGRVTGERQAPDMFGACWRRRHDNRRVLNGAYQDKGGHPSGVEPGPETTRPTANRRLFVKYAGVCQLEAPWQSGHHSALPSSSSSSSSSSPYSLWASAI